MICKKCNSDLVEYMDEGKLDFEYRLQGQTMIVRKSNLKHNFVCLACGNQFQERKPKAKKECLMVDVDFSEWEIVLHNKEFDNMIWFFIRKGNSIQYFCKGWGKEMKFLFNEQDFFDGNILSAELRTEMNKKDGKEGQPFMVLNFNLETINQRES